MTLRSTAAKLALALTIAGAGLVSMQPGHAAILVDQISPYANYVGGGDWGNFTTALAGQPGGYTVGSIANAAQVAAADAILVVYRNAFLPDPFLSAAEIANLTAFLATGKRVVIVGEGNFWDVWNDSILAFASGGTATHGAVLNVATTPVVANDLTQGVGSITLQGAGTTVGGTGTQLFNTNFATLWGDNLLTVLDAQVFSQFNAPAFRDNVADWLGESKATAVPEPATWGMMLPALALGFLATRRKDRNTTKSA